MKKLPEYEFHPLANLFPLMSEEELDVLARDIEVNGLTCPIILYEGKILDGRNRYLACKRTGVIPEFCEYLDDTPLQFVLSINLHRRHLTTQQRAEIADKLATLPQGARTDLASNESRFSQSQAADAMQVSRSSVQRVRTARRRREAAKSESPSEFNGDHDEEANNAAELKEISPQLKLESLARKKCITQFRVFVRELSQQLHTPQREIKHFIKVFISLDTL
jgi:hypothetical protein